MTEVKEIRSAMKKLQVRIDQNNFSSYRQREEANREMRNLRALLHSAKIKKQLSGE